MNVKRYLVEMEIEGALAIFSRPDCGDTPCSYPVPTWSASKGVFEAVARMHGAYISPMAVEICRPIKYRKYVTNYGGPLRKATDVKKGNSFQLQATVLENVCYRLYGEAINSGEHENSRNPAHALQERFERRIKKSRCQYVPCLGWKEFSPSYFGVIREDADERFVQPHSEIIPSMLHSVFDKPMNGTYAPVFHQNVMIDNGRLEYAQ